MLDKLLLNNQLLANKKKVRQAKINIINRLVKKIRKLKQIIEKKPDDTKLKRKLDKSSDILAAIKKVQSVDLLKKSLANDKNPNSVITNGKGSPEEIAQALLFAHKSISEVTKMLKELLNLDDERNPGWREELQELSKRKQKIQRMERKTNAGQQKKENPSRSKQGNEWIEQNSFNGNCTEETLKLNEYTPEAAGWKVIKTDEDERPETISKNLKAPSIRETKIKESKTIEEPLLEESGSLKHVSKAVDPFFVTKSGDNYLSTVVIDRVQPEAPNDGMVRKERREQAFGYVGRPWQAKTNRNNSKNLTKSQSKVDTSQSTKKKDSNNDEVHPSWAAKRKQKTVPVFEGKKIKFDDNGETNINIGKKTANIKTNSIEVNEKLHPSWEAKQKMRQTISEFKGKKIVFDDD